MQSKEFIDDRRAGLEKYLQRLVMHPVIGTSKEMIAFLTLGSDTGSGSSNSNQALSVMPEWNNTDSAQGSAGGGNNDGSYSVPGGGDGDGDNGDPSSSAHRAPSLVGRFKHAMSNFASGTGGGPNGDGDPSKGGKSRDADLEEKRDKLSELEKVLGGSSAAAEQLLKKQEDVGDALGELGLALIKLSKSEDAESQRLGNYSHVGSALSQHAADVRRVGTASVRMSRLARAADDQTALQLSPLHDHLGMLPAARTSLQDRVDARRHLILLKDDHSARSSRLEKLEKGEGGRSLLGVLGGRAQTVRELDFLSKDVPALATAVKKSEQELEEIIKRNESEMARVADERKESFNVMLRGLGRVQAAYAERSESIWQATTEAMTKSGKESGGGASE